jgi:uncharacterized membrane protein (DUF4010 family)
MNFFSSYPLLLSILTALGIGLIIGVVRERQHQEVFAGVRTHTLTALVCVVAAYLGTPVLITALILVLVLISLAYWRSASEDPGLTGEVALMLTALLGALAESQPAIASGLGALTASLLYAKTSLHRFSHEVLSENEVHDGLILLASALIILPLLPNHAIDPLGVFNPAKMWRLVVLVMSVGAFAHIALRLIGSRFGLPLAGFFSGYVSSTAATLNFAQTSKQTPTLTNSALSAALLSNAASLSLFVPILMATSMDLLYAIAPEISVAFLCLVLFSVPGLHRSEVIAPETSLVQKRMFRMRHALGLVAIISAILLASAAFSQWLGPHWAIAISIISAAAELHAALIGIAQLAHSGILEVNQSHWALLGLLGVSAAVKITIAFIYGSTKFAWGFAIVMLTMLLLVTTTALLTG